MSNEKEFQVTPNELNQIMQIVAKVAQGSAGYWTDEMRAICRNVMYKYNESNQVRPEPEQPKDYANNQYDWLDAILSQAAEDTAAANKPVKAQPSKTTQCSNCHGKGRVVVRKHNFDAIIPCPICSSTSIKHCQF